MEDIQYKNLTIKITQEQDQEFFNPREDRNGNVGTMICFHREYELGDQDHGYKHDQFEDMEDMADQLRKDGAVIIIPLTIYDHSGITMSAGRVWETGFPDQRWDCSEVGYIVAFRERILKIIGWKRLNKSRLLELERMLRGEVETYDQYLTGDIYYYSIEDRHGEQIDGCGGFFGYEDCEQEARSAARRIYNDAQKERTDKIKTMIKHNVPYDKREQYILSL
jgi:hypothetical protein